MSSMWSQMSGLPGSPPLPAITGGGTPPIHLPPNTGGVYPRPRNNPVLGIPGDTTGQGINEQYPLPYENGGGDPRPSTGPGSLPYNGANPRGRQPEWGGPFRRPNFWQAVRQMAQPSVSNSAANQARAQQQQSNAARARAAFLSGFNNVRRPMNQYREREQVAAPYAGGIDRGNGLYSPGMRHQYGGGPALGNQPRGYAY